MEYVWYKKGDALVKELTAKSPSPAPGQLEIWYLGQMGIVVKGGGITVGFDLILNDLYYADGSSRRNFDPPFAPEKLTGVDFCVCSHNHADHLNMETLLPVSRAEMNTRFVVPAPVVSALTEGGIPESRVIPARAGKGIPLGEHGRLIPIAACHEEYFTDERGDFTCLGFILELNGVRLYHAGDTIFTEKLVSDVTAYGSVHIACLPINGSGAEFHSRNVIGNLNEKDAAYLAYRLNADLTLPLHSDMVKKNEGNPLIFAYYMQKDFPGKKYHICQLGERFVYRL